MCRARAPWHDANPPQPASPSDVRTTLAKSGPPSSPRLATPRLPHPLLNHTSSSRQSRQRRSTLRYRGPTQQNYNNVLLLARLWQRCFFLSGADLLWNPNIRLEELCLKYIRFLILYLIILFNLVLKLLRPTLVHRKKCLKNVRLQTK